MSAQPPPPPPPPPPEEPGTGPTQVQPAAPPPPAYPGVSDDSPGAGGSGDGSAGVGWRILAAFLVLVGGLLAAGAIIGLIDVADAPTCFDRNRDPDLFDQECFEGSDKRKILTLVLGFAGSAVAVAGLALGLAFVARGRGWRNALIAFLAGAALFGLAILAENI